MPRSIAVGVLLKSGDRHICMSSSTNALGVNKLREEGIRKTITKREGIIFNIVTAIDEEEYSRRMEDVLKHDGIQLIMTLDEVVGELALNKAHE